MRGGFTLIELLFVILLFSVLMAMAAPVYRGVHQNIALDVAADRLIGLLAYGRERAIMERSRLRLEIEPASGAYRLLIENPSVPGNFNPLRESLGRGILLPDGLRLESAQPAIEFSPDGTASENSLRITGPADDVRRIELDPVSGEAKIYEFTHG